MNHIVRRVTPLFAALVLVACATTPTPRTISQTAASDPRLSTLSRLLTEADLTATLDGAGPYTVFAPTDDAFKAVPKATLDALMKDKARLKAVLTYHVVPGTITSAELKNGPIKTVQGANVALYKSGTFVTVEEAVVTTPDVRATNGVIQVIDKVLIPPSR